MVNVAIDRPPSTRRESERRRGFSFVVAACLAAFSLVGGFWLGRATAHVPLSMPRLASKTTEGVRPQPAPEPAAPVLPAAVVAPSSAPVAPARPVTPPAAVSLAAAPGRLVGTLEGPLEETIARAIPPADRGLAEELTQVVNRLLVWDLHVAKDGRRGDKLEVLYMRAAPITPGMVASAEPVVRALRYSSQKLGRTIEAYRFQAPGEKFARYYRPDGTEVEERLVGGPIDDYDQVTSLLKDGRHHEGVDFRTPPGTPVKSPFDGVVLRRTWKFGANGNCLEIRDEATGMHAKFLHLEEVSKDMSPGRHVKHGEVIAHSGNTGHSFAPHLHYQLEDSSGRVLDPFDVHKTTRRALSSADLPAFRAEREHLASALFGGEAISSNAAEAAANIR